MAITKSAAVIWNGITLTASAGDTTSAGQNLAAAYGAVLDLKLTNGATGPTVAAQIQIQVSEDNSNYYNYGGALKGSTVNSAVSQWGGIEVPLGTNYVRLVGGSNTGQNVTARAEISMVTKV
jgi:hypothetical protein